MTGLQLSSFSLNEEFEQLPSLKGLVRVITEDWRCWQLAIPIAQYGDAKSALCVDVIKKASDPFKHRIGNDLLILFGRGRAADEALLVVKREIGAQESSACASTPGDP